MTEELRRDPNLEAIGCAILAVTASVLICCSGFATAWFIFAHPWT